MDQQQLSVQQFGERASNYLTSTVHATGADLERLKSLANQHRPARVLDLGCGAGHVSFALAAGGARNVTAYDPSQDMLTVVAQEAAKRGHTGIETRVGVAEVLPFENDSFDLVV
ncbi:MAG TPA: class I SAM-dependent methyltransferase, partial [Steroidobacteraceae bacterium]|nr:class I SAM-dependent methyltransferase [Steroidobacteraceae bacterium]